MGIVRLTFVSNCRLDQRLCGVREQAAGEAKHDLTADDTRIVCHACSTVANEDAKGEDEAEDTKDHERLDTLDEPDDDAESETGKDTGEGVQGGNASC